MLVHLQGAINSAIFIKSNLRTRLFNQTQSTCFSLLTEFSVKRGLRKMDCDCALIKLNHNFSVLPVVSQINRWVSIQFQVQQAQQYRSIGGH